jgi:hypothetical protein
VLCVSEFDITCLLQVVQVSVMRYWGSVSIMVAKLFIYTIGAFTASNLLLASAKDAASMIISLLSFGAGITAGSTSTSFSLTLFFKIKSAYQVLKEVTSGQFGGSTCNK